MVDDDFYADKLAPSGEDDLALLRLKRDAIRKMIQLYQLFLSRASIEPSQQAIPSDAMEVADEVPVQDQNVHARKVVVESSSVLIISPPNETDHEHGSEENRMCISVIQDCDRHVVLAPDKPESIPSIHASVHTDPDPTLPGSAFEIVLGTPLSSGPPPSCIPGSEHSHQHQPIPQSLPSSYDESPSFSITLDGSIKAVFLLPTNTGQSDTVACLLERSSSPSSLSSPSHSLFVIQGKSGSRPHVVARMDLRYTGPDSLRNLDSQCSLQLLPVQMDQSIGSIKIMMMISRGIWTPLNLDSTPQSKSAVDLYSFTSPPYINEKRQGILGEWKIEASLTAQPEFEAYCALSVELEDGGQTVIAGGRNGMINTWEGSQAPSSLPLSPTPLPRASYKGLPIQELVDLKLVPVSSYLNQEPPSHPLLLGTAQDATFVIWDLTTRQILASLHPSLCHLKPRAFPMAISLSSNGDQSKRNGQGLRNSLMILTLGTAEPQNSQDSSPTAADGRALDRIIPISWTLTSSITSATSDLIPTYMRLNEAVAMLDSSNSNLGSIDRIEVTSLSVDLNVAAIGTTSGHIFLWNMDAGGLIGALRPLQSVTDSGSGGDDPHHPQRGVDALALRMNEDGLGYRLTAAIGKELILIVS